jgi:hypothetical protein
VIGPERTLDKVPDAAVQLHRTSHSTHCAAFLTAEQPDCGRSCRRCVSSRRQLSEDVHTKVCAKGAQTSQRRLASKQCPEFIAGISSRKVGRRRRCAKQAADWAPTVCWSVDQKMVCRNNRRGHFIVHPVGRNRGGATQPSKVILHNRLVHGLRDRCDGPRELTAFAVVSRRLHAGK